MLSLPPNISTCRSHGKNRGETKRRLTTKLKSSKANLKPDGHHLVGLLIILLCCWSWALTSAILTQTPYLCCCLSARGRLKHLYYRTMTSFGKAWFAWLQWAAIHGLRVCSWDTGFIWSFGTPPFRWLCPPILSSGGMSAYFLILATASLLSSYIHLLNSRNQGPFTKLPISVGSFYLLRG